MELYKIYTAWPTVLEELLHMYFFVELRSGLPGTVCQMPIHFLLLARGHLKSFL